MKTVLVDFGNVIGFFDHQRAIRQLARFTDLPIESLDPILYGGKIEDDYESGLLSTAEYVRLAKDHARLTCTDDEFLAAYTDIFWRNDEVCDLLPKLKPNYRLVLASNTNDAHYRRYCADFADVVALFDAKCPSHEAGSRKPRAPYYEFCQRFVDAEPGECLFIDDLAKNIDAGNRIGWAGVVYRPGDGLIEKLQAAGIRV